MEEVGPFELTETDISHPTKFILRHYIFTVNLLPVTGKTGGLFVNLYVLRSGKKKPPLFVRAYVC